MVHLHLSENLNFVTISYYRTYRLTIGLINGSLYITLVFQLKETAVKSGFAVINLLKPYSI